MSVSGSRGPDLPEPADEAGPGARRLRLALSRADRPPHPSEPALGVLDPGRAAAARALIRSWPEYEPTPLVPLPGLARRAGVAEVWCKDETDRFGIGSFKALGGAYAVLRSLQEAIERRTGVRPEADELEAGHRAAAGVTVATASAGNHGRSVAWGAERFGCRAVVVLPRDVDPERASAIASHGARVLRFDGAYDEAVRHVEARAIEEGWIVVSDTAYPGYEEIPRRVMEGYTLLAEEILEGLAAAGAGRLTHLFIQAGVGGLATGVCGGLWHPLGPDRPRFIAVEPWRADCFGRSLRHGRMATARPPFDTAMGGLAAGVPSTLAWRFLEGCLDAALALPESGWRVGAEALASGELGPAITAGPSGAAGVGALLALAGMLGMKCCVSVGSAARVGVVITETRF